MTGALRLRPPRAEDEAACRAAQRELAADDFEFVFGLTDDTPWDDHLRRMDDQRHARNLPPGLVPGTFLVAVVGADLVGRSSIRFELNDYLASFGGHIGYGVRPGFRRRGHATEILRQSLVVARAAGVDDVLVTCDDDNLGSAAVIETCGGELESVVEGPGGPGDAPLRRYWIR